MQPPTSVTGWGLGAGALALLLTALAWWTSGGGIFSPGELSSASRQQVALGGIAAHAELSRDCGACHVPPWSGETMAERCLGCHVDIQRERSDTTALHGMLADVTPCRACHTEHRGPAGNLTRPGGRAFPHEGFGFSLAAHLRTAEGRPFTCASCHGGDSFRFEPGRCVSCHREYQPAFVTTHTEEWGSSCLECHDGTDRFSSGVFDHGRLDFALTGAHARVACVACHVNVHAAEGFRAAPTECIGCHRPDDAHRGEFGTDCASCHSTSSWEDATFVHTFPLTHGARRAAACTVCHQDAPRSYRSHTCYGCHEHTPEDIREEHLEEGIRDFRDCVSCHPTGREDEAEERRR
jgi:hypothetical protein